MDRRVASSRHNRRRLTRRLVAALLAVPLLQLTPAPAAATDGPYAAASDSAQYAGLVEQQDRCVYGYSPASSVWFGSGAADSGVPNYDLGDGCTVLDVIWQEAPFDNHGAFVSTVSRITRQLRTDGALTAGERASIVRAAARSAIGTKPTTDGDRAVDMGKIGLVLYTVRATMPSNAEGTMAALAACGFENAEPSGSVGNYYNRNAAGLAPLAAAAGLNVPSIGISLSDLENKLDGVIADAKAFGARYVRISGSASWSLARYSEVAGILNRVGAQLKEAGITVAYHNHGFEFDDKGGVRGYDVLVRETDPNLVAFELDTYWVANGGADPVDVIKQYPGRFALLHLKDMAPNGSFADVGTGVLDFPQIFAYSEMGSVDYAFIEHDNPRPDGVTSACHSRANLSTLRY